MSKISQIESLLLSGARTNKYRVMFSRLGREIDILCHDVQLPGIEMGIAEVYIKGRKLKLAGDRGDGAEITMNFYNEETLGTRNYLIGLMQKMQNYTQGWASQSGDYFFEVKIQQLDHDERVSSQTILHNAFLSSVGDIEYTDETGEVSLTPLVIQYTDLTVG